MSFCQKQYVGIASTIRRPLKVLIGIALIIFVTACTSQGARDAELAAQQAELAAHQAEIALAKQEAARIVQEQARQQEAAEREQREAAATERAREQSELDRREAEDLARAEAERRQREEADRREEQRLAAIAAAEAERRDKLERISVLERQIASIQSGTDRNESATAVLQEAILVAEELLAVLVVEQAKYEETDLVSGHTIEPLATEQIAELEARKDDLIRQARSQ